MSSTANASGKRDRSVGEIPLICCAYLHAFGVYGTAQGTTPLIPSMRNRMPQDALIVLGIHNGEDKDGKSIMFVNFLSPKTLGSCKAAAESFGGLVPITADGKQKASRICCCRQ